MTKVLKNGGRKSNGEGSTRQLENGTWECVMQSKYLNPSTNKPKRIKRRGKTEKESIKKCKLDLMAWEKQFERSKDIKVDKKKTYGDYMKEFVEKEVKHNITDSSYKSYIYALNANFYNYKISKLQLNMLNTVEFEVYFDTIIHDKSYRTAEVPIQLNKRCCTWLYGLSLIPDDYASFAKIKKEKKDEYFRDKEKEKREQKKVFSNDDIVKFYNSYKNSVSEYSAAVVLLLETMMRAQELLPLTIDDIDFEKNIINIRSAVGERFIDNDQTKGLEYYVKVPKNGKERIVHMTPLAREVVEYMIEQTRMKCRQNPDNLLFPSYLKHGKMRSMDAFEIQFKSLCDKIGVDRDVRKTKLPSGKVINKGLNVHALRHTAITIANTAPQTKYSAGYDIASPASFVLKPGESIKFPTGLRCHMKDDNVLLIHVRSSVGFKYHTILSNVTGVIDADYVNAKNEGHIFVKLVNHGDKDFVINEGDDVVQGIFMKFNITDDDVASGERIGGFGSTGK